MSAPRTPAAGGPGDASASVWRQLTAPQADPVGRMEHRPLVIAVVGTLAMVLIAHGVLRAVPAERPLLALLALVLLAVAALLLVRFTAPQRAPVRRPSNLLVTALGLVALCLDVASGWVATPAGPNNLVPLTIGSLIFLSAAYRPAAEVIAEGAVATGVIAGAAILHATLFPSAVHPVMELFSWVVPVAALTAGGAAYAMAATRAACRVALAPPSIQAADGAQVRSASARARLLDDSVAPLLRRVLRDDAVSPGDADEAADIAASLREAMVADFERSWVTAAVDATMPPGCTAVVDASVALAETMTAEQRAALRALLAATTLLPSPPTSLVLTLRPDGERTRLVLAVRFRDEGAAVGRLLAPYLEVMVLAFHRVVVHADRPALRLDALCGG